MRNLASALIVMTCALGLGAPALAAGTMSSHEAPAPIAAGAARAPAVAREPLRAHPAPASMPDRGADRDRDNGHHHHGHHRHGVLLPFDAFDEGLAPQVLVAQPDASGAADLVPPAPPVADVERPPCRETSAGVVILRGTGCTRGDH